MEMTFNMPQGRNEKLPKLSEAEGEIMEIMWKNRQPLTSTYVMEQLTSRTWALSTVMTALAKLCEKGFVYCDRTTRTNYYSALISEQDYRAGQSREFLKTMHQNSIANMVTALSNSGEISDSEIEQLREILNRR